VYSSTSAAYGLANTPPLTESAPTDCLNPYSVGKVSGESMCRMYARLYGMETVTFRYFNVYGERQPLRGQYAPVIGIFLRQRAAGEPMTIVGDGEQRRDFTYVGDVVEANLLAAKAQNIPWGEIYNIGTGRNYSINEIANHMGGATVNIPPRPAESRLSLADASKANTYLGWTAKVRLEDWISQHK
jgi:nucleoside-diphosphate-sugar epimerase